MTLPDKDSLSTYGGALNNYSDVVDPSVEEDAAWRNKYAANVAMMTRTILRCARSFLGTTGGATAVADPSTGFVHESVWGSLSSVKPSVTHVATATYDAIWPTGVADELGETHTISLQRAWAQAESSDGTLRVANAKVTGAQKVRIYTYKVNASGQVFLDELANEVITVFAF